MKAHYLLGKNKFPDEFGAELNKVVIKLRNIKTKDEVLHEAYNVIVNRYYGKRFHTYLKILDSFSDGIQDLWNRSGFMHCSNQNFLLSFLLIKSGAFRDSDIQGKWTFYWGISPHQYLRVGMGDNEFIDVDPWSAAYGIKFGDHAHGFHARTRL